MRIEKQSKSVQMLHSELQSEELLLINGGSEPDLAYIAGYSYVFTTAHILTGGLSSWAYLLNKLLG